MSIYNYMTYPFTTLETIEIVEKGEAITNPTLRLMERLCLKCPVGMWGWGFEGKENWEQSHLQKWDSSHCNESR